jgi:hypothetical protein
LQQIDCGTSPDFWMGSALNHGWERLVMRFLAGFYMRWRYFLNITGSTDYNKRKLFMAGFLDRLLKKDDNILVSGKVDIRGQAYAVNC